MSKSDCQKLVIALTEYARNGYKILTWNGLGFDFDILAEESEMFNECRNLALDHVDMMFHFFCSQGFTLSLNKAAQGMGLSGKTSGMHGGLAPKMWQRGQYREVLEYVSQDVKTTLEVALSVEKVGVLTWTSNRGNKMKWKLEGRHWFTVREALTLPEPDTSWMTNPWPRSKFYAWIGWEPRATYQATDTGKLATGETKTNPFRQVLNALTGKPQSQNLKSQSRTVASPSKLKPTEQNVEPEMILIPAGKFLMGSDPQKDKNTGYNEQPQHYVYLPNYYIAKTPVTQAQYAAFLQATGHRPAGDMYMETDKTDHPIVLYSWHDALVYCKWLSEVTGKPYRLPTEAEWEKAARSSDGRIYPWGNQWDANRCNISRDFATFKPRNTTSVNAYPNGASPYGVLDMVGNVWEWCVTYEDKTYPYDVQEDEWSVDYLRKPGSRMLRGGFWNYEGARCATRTENPTFHKCDPELGFQPAGFRLVTPLDYDVDHLIQILEEVLGEDLNRSIAQVTEEVMGKSIAQYPRPTRTTSVDTSPSKLKPAEQSVEPEMVLIPAGKFLMGSDPQKDKNAGYNEQPQHYVYLPDYYIAKTPITQAQYADFLQATGHRAPYVEWDEAYNWSEKSPPEGKENHPVTLVSWYDALVYCKWLSEVTGKPYRLPTEAEWEKAARGSDGRNFPWGNQWDAEYCNTIESGKYGTTPVGAYPNGASPYGVLDMAGNVWEWCAVDEKISPESYSGYQGSSQNKDHLWVLRGGAWNSPRHQARCSSYYRPSPNLSYNYFGFRIVLLIS